VLVKELPDMERSVEEQEEEMAELEEKIRKQRDVLRRLREVGLEIKKGRELRQQNGGRDAMES